MRDLGDPVLSSDSFFCGVRKMVSTKHCSYKIGPPLQGVSGSKKIKLILDEANLIISFFRERTGVFSYWGWVGSGAS